MRGKPTQFNDLATAFRNAAPYINVVYVFISAVILFTGAGWWLDTKFDTKPILLLIGLFAGLITGFYYLLKVVNKLEKTGK
jgi:F0F1-type ATP synthase assembly protein I